MHNTLPKLALGTWLMGGAKGPNPDNDDEGDIAVIGVALDKGIKLIDTAQNYAAGKCEELVGEAVHGYARDSYKILTKQHKNRLTFDEVITGCKESMLRLGIEYIDYFVCHAPNADVDMKEFFKASNRLFKDGLIRHVGVSNFGPRTLRIALETSEQPIALNQVSFSVNDADILNTGTYDFCVENNIPIQAYRPLADIDKDKDIAELLKSIGAGLNLSPQQVSVAYLNSYKNMHFTVRVSSSKHWRELEKALQVKLSDSNIESIKKLHITKKGIASHFLSI